MAFGADPAAFESSNGYIVEEQGKPPDLVLEIASERTGRVDVGAKREDYERLQIPEYWRFDETETGRHHGARLGGDILVDGRYQPADIRELSGGTLQGYSPMLDLYLRWERGELALIDPATGQPIATIEDERARADSAEARIRELEEENRRLRGS